MRVLFAILFLASVLVALPVFAAKGDVSVTYAYIYLNVTNEPPTITSLELAPSPIYEDSEIECRATATDREDDVVNYYYTWFVNDVEIDFSQMILPNQYFTAGDVVVCEAVAYDRYDNGTSARASAMVQAIPLQTRIVKTTLAAAGVTRTASEISSVSERGFAATTGYVVKEVGQSSAVPIGLLIIAIGFLVLVNVNLLLRLRRRAYQKPSS